MISRRIWINLGVFLALFLWLCVWAVQNVIRLDAIERPYTITAAFDSTPGLRDEVEVTYLGVRVGRIQSVDLEHGEVIVALGIDRDVDLPVGVTAAIRRKSAVGEPYVALDPPEGFQPGDDTIDHGGDHRIPKEMTSVPLSYGELFVALDDLVEGVPHGALGTVLDEVATALDGRGDELRQIIQGGADIAGTLAERSEMFDELASELTSLTHTITAERAAIGRSFDNLAGLTGALADSRADLDALLRDAPTFGQQVQALLEATTSDLGCAFAATGALFERIGAPEQIAQLLRVLDVAAEADRAFNIAVIEAGQGGADGPYLSGSIGITAPGIEPPPPTYNPRPELPTPPPLPTCTEPGAAPPAAAGDRSVAAGDPADHAASDPLDVSRRPAAPAPDLPESSDAPVGDQRFPLALGVGLVGVVLLIALAVLTSRRGGPGRRPAATETEPGPATTSQTAD